MSHACEIPLLQSGGEVRRQFHVQHHSFAQLRGVALAATPPEAEADSPMPRLRDPGDQKNATSPSFASTVFGSGSGHAWARAR
jgi:hypothetical protein